MQFSEEVPDLLSASNMVVPLHRRRQSAGAFQNPQTQEILSTLEAEKPTSQPLQIYSSPP